MTPTHATCTVRTVGEIFEDFPFTSEHLKACLVLFVTFVIEAWALMIIVYCADSIRTDLGIGTLAQGHLISAIFIGMAFGAIFWGRVSNRFGRKRSLIWSLAGYGLVSMLSAFAPDYFSLYVLRLLVGVVVAGILVIVIAYFVELLPMRLRGTATVLLSAGWPIGMLVALAVSHVWLDHGWRWIIAISSLAGLWALALWRWVPESPYWLAGAGQQQHARAVLQHLGGAQLTLPAHLHLQVETVEHSGMLDALRGQYLRITLIQCLINFVFSWGYWGLQTWLPTLLQERGLSVPDSYGFIALSALVMIPGYLSAGWATQRFGRKWVMVVYVSMAAVAGFIFAASHTVLMLYIGNFALVFFNQGAWGVWNTWMGELYETRLRTPGFGWGILAQRITNIIAPIIIGALVAANAGFFLIIGFITSFIAATVILALLLPETEGQRIE